MGTLKLTLKLTKYRLLYMKGPIGWLYRKWWRKQLIKRITEVSNIIQQKTNRPQVIPVRLDMDNFHFHIPYVGTFNGIPVIENPQGLFMLECCESSDIG